MTGASYTPEDWSHFLTLHRSRILGLARCRAPDLTGPWLRPQALTAAEDGSFVLRVDVRYAARGAHVYGEAPRGAIAQAIQEVLGVCVQVQLVPASPR